MSKDQPSKIPCSTTAAVFLITNDGIQVHRCYSGVKDILHDHMEHLNQKSVKLLVRTPIQGLKKMIDRKPLTYTLSTIQGKKLATTLQILRIYLLQVKCLLGTQIV